MGQLALKILDKAVPEGISIIIDENGKPFDIVQDESDGSLCVLNYRTTINKKRAIFQTKLNAKGNYPFYCQVANVDEVLVFDENGEFTAEFVNHFTPKKDFIQEWNNEQFSIMRKHIVKWFSGKPIITNQRKYSPERMSWKKISDLLGLVYTSSSNYAGYWICNVELTFTKEPRFKYIGFAISKDNKYYAVLWDEDENEKIIEI